MLGNFDPVEPRAAAGFRALWAVLLVFICWTGLLAAPTGRAAETVDCGFPAELTLQNSKLVLNGTATRSVWGFGVYRIGLFLSERSADADSIIGSNRSPKRVRIAMLREVSEEQFADTVQTSIDRNFSDGEKKKFAQELAAFLGTFRNGADLREGSIVTIDYLPGKGMSMGLDDRPIGSIPGDDFYHAILRLWIGKPIQPSIRTGLLGLDAAGS